MTESNNSMSESQLVVFDLASEHYGVDIADVREILRMQEITKVPGAEVYIEGVINLRGKVLPVLDLRKRLGLKIAELTDESRVVVIDRKEGEVGVIVDSVTEVLRVPNEAIVALSSMLQGNSDYLRGIAKLTDRLIILLDLNKLLSSKDDSAAIARRLAEHAAKAAIGEVIDQPTVAPKNGNEAKKKPGEVIHKGNNKKEHAVA